MIDVLHIMNGRHGYADILAYVRQHGEHRSPRGIDTIDAGNTIIVLENPYDALPIDVGRGINTKIAYAEAIQLIGGFTDPQFMFNIAPQFKKYAEDDETFHGAYGRRIGRQLTDVYNKLRRDPETRQAVITLWHSTLDAGMDKRDYPCTIAIGFSLRRGKLNMNVTMRSNDAWLGLPYDLFQFSQLQLTLATALDVDPGVYTHNAWSLHLYKRDLDATYEVFVPTGGGEHQPTGFGVVGSHVSNAVGRAYRLHRHGHTDIDDLTESEEKYRDVLYR